MYNECSHFRGLPMEASIVDLRYKMRDILKALDRREKVKILYHGKLRGILLPSETHCSGTVKQHPYFGLAKGSKTPVNKIMNRLRGDRYAL